jgi:hypothetical protein
VNKEYMMPVVDHFVPKEAVRFLEFVEKAPEAGKGRPN